MPGQTFPINAINDGSKGSTCKVILVKQSGSPDPYLEEGQSEPQEEKGLREDRRGAGAGTERTEPAAAHTSVV